MMNQIRGPIEIIDQSEALFNNSAISNHIQDPVGSKVKMGLSL